MNRKMRSKLNNAQAKGRRIMRDRANQYQKLSPQEICESCGHPQADHREVTVTATISLPPKATKDTLQ